MRRLVIVGRSGSGKSRLARRLGRQLRLPVIHLDQLYWKPGWREPDIAEFRARVAAAIADDGWISDGSYALTTFDLRLPRADAIVWLERSRVLCTWRVLCRSMGLHKRSEELPEGCREHLDWTFLKYVWQFDALVRPRIETARRLYGPDVPVIRLGRAKLLPASRAMVSSATGPATIGMLFVAPAAAKTPRRVVGKNDVWPRTHQPCGKHREQIEAVLRKAGVEPKILAIDITHCAERLRQKVRSASCIGRVRRQDGDPR